MEQKEGRPGYPPLTQWYIDGVAPSRLKDGRHLLYLDATSGGNSGSPLYHYDTNMNIAYALAVHVGHDFTANMAVPIEYHLETSTKRLPVMSIPSKETSTEQGKSHLLIYQ